MHRLVTSHARRSVLGRQAVDGYEADPGLVWSDGRMVDFGDGTVPAYSGLPTQFEILHVSSPLRLRDRHIPMAASSVVVDLVKRYLDLAAPQQVHGPEEAERPPSLGLDLDDLQPTGGAIPVRAVLRELPVEVDPASVRVTLRMEPADGRVGLDPVVTRMRWDEAAGDFGADLPGCVAGLYRVRVVARQVPQVGDLEVSDLMAVADAEQIETGPPASDETDDHPGGLDG